MRIGISVESRGCIISVPSVCLASGVVRVSGGTICFGLRTVRPGRVTFTLTLSGLLNGVD